MLTLPQFIEKVGDQAAADLFGVERRTVESWRRRERFPRVEMSRYIVKVTNGEVSYVGIYHDELADPARAA